ncbi:hypothetical protein ACMBCN_00680 [Candidatus Liberibacter asiaticus]
MQVPLFPGKMVIPFFTKQFLTSVLVSEIMHYSSSSSSSSSSS